MLCTRRMEMDRCIGKLILIQQQAYQSAGDCDRRWCGDHLALDHHMGFVHTYKLTYTHAASTSELVCTPHHERPTATTSLATPRCTSGYVVLTTHAAWVTVERFRSPSWWLVSLISLFLSGSASSILTFCISFEIFWILLHINYSMKTAARTTSS